MDRLVVSKIADEFGVEEPFSTKGNLILRKLVNDRAAESPRFAGMIKALALSNIHVFMNLYAFTYDPRQDKDPHHFPFITLGQWEYQADFLDWLCGEIVDPGEDCHIDKSRDMGASWMVIATFVWYWLKNEAGNDFLLGSRKFEYVDNKNDMKTLFEKARYLLRFLPQYILPEGFDLENKTYNSKSKLFNPESGCTIVGEANNSNFGTGGRFKGMLYDEFSKWLETDEAAWTSGQHASYCRLALSTPWGTSDRKFHQLRHDTRIKHYTLHWTLHPHKDEEWYDKEAQRCDPVELAQEVDISYEGAAGKRFTPKYNPRIHRVPLKPIPHVEVIRLWDFGYHHPICLFTQIDSNDRWLWLYLIKGKDVMAADFALYVQEKSGEWFKPQTEFIDYGDPSGAYASDKGDPTIKQIYASTGIRIKTKDKSDVPLNVYKTQTARRLQALFGEFIGDEPRIRINDQPDDRGTTLPNFVDTQSMWHAHLALSGGLHYPRDKVDEFYEKDDIFDHLADAARYGIHIYFYKSHTTQEGHGSQRRLRIEKRTLQERKERVQEVRNGSYRPTGFREAKRASQRVKTVGRFR
jgi:hypothetical protein